MTVVVAIDNSAAARAALRLAARRLAGGTNRRGGKRIRSSADAGHPDEDYQTNDEMPGHGPASVVAAIRVGGDFDRDSGRYLDV